MFGIGDDNSASPQLSCACVETIERQLIQPIEQRRSELEPSLGREFAPDRNKYEIELVEDVLGFPAGISVERFSHRLPFAA